MHTAVRLIKESIPSFAIKGEDLLLECPYDLEGDTLYSVKWYKNGQEFYRHIPSDNPKTVVFGQPGLDIDVSLSSFILEKMIEIYRSNY